MDGSRLCYSWHQSPVVNGNKWKTPLVHTSGTSLIKTRCSDRRVIIVRWSQSQAGDLTAVQRWFVKSVLYCLGSLLRWPVLLQLRDTLWLKQTGIFFNNLKLFHFVRTEVKVDFEKKNLWLCDRKKKRVTVNIAFAKKWFLWLAFWI